MKYEKPQKIASGKKEEFSKKPSLVVSSTSREKDTEREIMLQRIQDLEDELNEVEQEISERDHELNEKKALLIFEQKKAERLSRENDMIQLKNEIRQHSMRQIQLQQQVQTIFNEAVNRNDDVDQSIINSLYPNPDNMTYEQLLELGEQIGTVSRGITQDQIDQIEVIEFNSISFNQESCSICYGEYKQGEKLKRLNCKHVYHIYCISTWLNREKKCPMCKEEILIQS